ncbi:glycosyltransferase family 2 protein [Haloimpatiens sp. FM7315]|uniref:glycosyltransferase family 2 protein n=1 Tax=Haloimpatiens sp. FM7315 TaxID=3298609 RepID=UPI00370A946A
MDGKVSVIIPAYNSAKTIISAIDSVMNQTYRNRIQEIIIVDDGSTDDTSKIVLKYCEQKSEIPICVIHKENGGVSSARNLGMENAKAEWLAFLDSDDEWLPDKIQHQLDILDANSNIDFLGGSLDGNPLKILTKTINSLYKANVKDVCIKNFPQPSTAIFRSSIYKNIGGFDENQRYAEDGNYFLKICSSYNFYYSPKQLVIYCGGKRQFGSSGLSANLKEMYKGNVKNIKELKRDSIISFKFYLFLRGFYLLKYVRRILITKFV